ncbi:MAG: NTP pyrophosphohydrolase [Candidatus Binatia bacterium]|nr:MAG: NTP pyrophosphohydrolase [Candidatus Binatia bacterium]
MPSKTSRRAKTRRIPGVPEISAGCVVTRSRGGNLEVLLIHPRGATFRKPLFGIPKGHVEPGEAVREAALRETQEETGLHVRIVGDLGTIRQKSGKIVHGFWAVVEPASEVLIDERGRCTAADPKEVDVCRFYPVERAASLMIPAQREFLDRLRAMMSSGAAESTS